MCWISGALAGREQYLKSPQLCNEILSVASVDLDFAIADVRRKEEVHDVTITRLDRRESLNRGSPQN